MKKRKPILVTGSHRSGTTWAGQMLAAAPDTFYLHEPLNANKKIGVLHSPSQYWYPYIHKENEKQFEVLFDDLLNFQYPLLRNLKNAKKIGQIRDVLKAQGRFLWGKMNNHRPILKDPLALFASEWLYSKYNMDVLVLIRHPAAFCSSLKLKNWTFDFINFTKQPSLMRKHLWKFEEDIKECLREEKDIIQQSIVLWNCIHYTIKYYQSEYPDWVFKKHEELSLNPLQEFKHIFNEFDLVHTNDVEKKIILSSGNQNPTEQTQGKEFIRNSKENIFNWKKRLTKKEIDMIRDKTQEISNYFYDEKDW